MLNEDIDWTLEQIKEETLKEIGSTDMSDVDYITEDLVNAGSNTFKEEDLGFIDEIEEEGDDFIWNRIWGHYYYVCSRNSRRDHCFYSSGPGQRRRACGERPYTLTYNSWRRRGQDEFCNHHDSDRKNKIHRFDRR